LVDIPIPHSSPGERRIQIRENIIKRGREKGVDGEKRRKRIIDQEKRKEKIKRAGKKIKKFPEQI
jgi:hypothetical protein